MTTQRGHAGQHHGVGTPECPTDLHHHHDERCEQVPVVVTAFEIVDGIKVPIGRPREKTISRGALDLLHGNVTPLEERRQRAREAGLDAWHDALAVPELDDRAGNALDDAIETATRVQITPEVQLAFLAILTQIRSGEEAPTCIEALKAAFEAAGFEVEQ